MKIYSSHNLHIMYVPYFLDQTPWLLFISLCKYYLRAVSILMNTKVHCLARILQCLAPIKPLALVWPIGGHNKHHSLVPKGYIPAADKSLP